MIEIVQGLGGWLSEDVATTRQWWIMWVGLAYLLGIAMERYITRFFAWVDAQVERRRAEADRLHRRMMFYSSPLVGIPYRGHTPRKTRRK